MTLEAVSFAYAQGKPVFSDVYLDVCNGSYMMVKGPSGAGKSTLLRLMNRLEEPNSGRILYHGRELVEYEPARLRRWVSYIQQTPVLVNGSVRDNLLLPFGFTANKDLERPTDDELQELLAAFLLDNVALDQNGLTCSVGQSQRLCLIRALLLKPEIMLLDEPTSALDKESRQEVEAMTEKVNTEHGVTVVMISHTEYAPACENFSEIEVRGGSVTVKEQTP